MAENYKKQNKNKKFLSLYQKACNSKYFLAIQHSLSQVILAICGKNNLCYTLRIDMMLENVFKCMQQMRLTLTCFTVISYIAYTVYAYWPKVHTKVMGSYSPIFSQWEEIKCQ